MNAAKRCTATTDVAVVLPLNFHAMRPHVGRFVVSGDRA